LRARNVGVSPFLHLILNTPIRVGAPTLRIKQLINKKLNANFSKAHPNRQKLAKVYPDVSRMRQVRESNSQPLLFRVNRSWHNKKQAQHYATLAKC
jgi:hypothetical protein